MFEFDHGLDQETRHAAAAMALVRKLGWDSREGYRGSWRCGSLPQKDAGFYVFVFASEMDNGYSASFREDS
ncbi:hypothetical protein [Paraburkholderia youngii]|uniref:Uncharacterized protein n=1 Tax=Paraburkholderia youngii TaxID=2782701 RepID=A0A7Y6JVS6_9BURK|nr:hypothetical protein [Paraburkholderia youngii]NUX98747.1 hypothetical protein [Paraburkholderia youngii]